MHLPVASSLEAPAAYVALAYALSTLVWKGIGLDWLPFIGAAWKGIVGTGDAVQYPRRVAHEEFWHTVYFLMYGAFGTVAQVCGLVITRRKLRSPASLVWCTRIYGLFHVTIGLHHLTWSLYKEYGKLELWRFHIPAVYAGTTLGVLLLLYHAVLLMMVSTRTVNLREICHRKLVMDTASCTTFISFAVFLVMNMIGLPTSYETNRTLWALTMYLVPVVVLFGTIAGPNEVIDK